MAKKDKKQAEKEIKEFFGNIEEKKPEEVRKIKRLAMHYNIKLGNLKKKFCKKCYAFLGHSKRRINEGVITITCSICGHTHRYKFK